MIYIVDIDGTIADITHRLNFIQMEQKDWKAFHEHLEKDKPIFEVISVIRALDKAGHTILYSTGRDTTTKDRTIAWLDRYRLPNVAESTLYMRTPGDHREDFIVKSELLNRIMHQYGEGLGGYGGAFEDRQQVVDMYRARGLRVFQVAKGAY